MDELIIIEEETRQKLVETINDSHLPAFALEAMIREIHEQLLKEKARQLNEALQKREQLQQDKEKKKKEVKNGQN